MPIRRGNTSDDKGASDVTTATLTERSLPNNLEAEKAVLGAVVINNALFTVAAERVGASDFYREAHRLIFLAMDRLHAKRQAIDLVTLKDVLVQYGDIDRVGGPAYLASIVDGVPRSTNVEHYAEIVRGHAIRRELIFASNHVLSRAYDLEDEPDALVDFAQAQVMQVSTRVTHSQMVCGPELAKEAIADLDAPARDHIFGVATGFDDLDEMTSGFQRGDMVVIAGRPSSGKTALAVNVATHAAFRGGLSVVLFSLEMSRKAITDRILAAEGRVEGQKIRRNRLSKEDYTRLVPALQALDGSRLAIDDGSALSALEVGRRARKVKLQHGLDLVVIDYMQLMRGGARRYESRTLEVGDISRTLKALAKDLDVPVVALSQLNRDVEGRKDRRPQLNDLRESGAIEADADVVLLVYRPEMYDSRPECEGDAEIIIAKQRNGPTGTIKLAYLKEYTRFETQEWRR